MWSLHRTARQAHITPSLEAEGGESTHRPGRPSRVTLIWMTFLSLDLFQEPPERQWNYLYSRGQDSKLTGKKDLSGLLLRRAGQGRLWETPQQPRCWWPSGWNNRGKARPARAVPTPAIEWCVIHAHPVSPGLPGFRKGHKEADSKVSSRYLCKQFLCLKSHRSQYHGTWNGTSPTPQWLPGKLPVPYRQITAKYQTVNTLLYRHLTWFPSSSVGTY
jgi:hypothetical protein